MEIYLIRHTTPACSKEICYGQSDISLSESFEEEVKIILSKLPEKFDYVYSSPLSRCVRLAQKLKSSNPVILEERLRELNFGDWEMKRWDEIEKEKLGKWMDDFVNVKPPRGESYAELQTRAVNFLQSFPTNVTSVAIVTHAGVIRAILSYLATSPLKESFREKIGYGFTYRLTHAV